MKNPPQTYPDAVDFMSKNVDIAVVITSAEIPFLVENVNDAWTKLCGYNEHEVIGRSFRLLQGAKTDAAATEHLCQSAKNRTSAETVVYNYRKDGSLFRNYIQIFPLKDPSSSTISHYMGILQEIPEA